MPEFTLHIDAPDGVQDVTLGEELTIGRTSDSALVIADPGLSRRNTTFFRDGDDMLVVDEGSLNGTFLNGEPVTTPRIVRVGDEIRIGSSTTVTIRGDSKTAEPAEPVESQAAIPQKPLPPTPNTPAASGTNLLLIAAGVFAFLIIIGAGITYLVVSRRETTVANSGRPAPRIDPQSRIPMRVIDPLGGENEDDLDDLIASWETEEKEIDAATVSDVAVSAEDRSESDLNVSAALFADRQKKAMEPRNGETGIRPSGLNVPKELYGDGVIKQKAKLREMKAAGYRQPLDFADLAEKRLKKELVEMPMAGESYYLDVGGSAGDGPFLSFAFPNLQGEIAQGNPKFEFLAQLASSFSGQKYDLGNAAHRKQMRVRLLRMFNKLAKPILLELANAYYAKFNRPLRVTSLTRSMDYQISLNATNANSFKVSGPDSLPPHTSGCAFDLARKHMTAEEQNFVMAKLAEMENANRLDALIEYNANACFHVFIYSDGVPPKL